MVFCYESTTNQVAVLTSNGVHSLENVNRQDYSKPINPGQFSSLEESGSSNSALWLLPEGEEERFCAFLASKYKMHSEFLLNGFFYMFWVGGVRVSVTKIEKNDIGETFFTCRARLPKETLRKILDSIEIEYGYEVQGA